MQPAFVARERAYRHPVEARGRLRRKLRGVRSISILSDPLVSWSWGDAGAIPKVDLDVFVDKIAAVPAGERAAYQPDLDPTADNPTEGGDHLDEEPRG